MIVASMQRPVIATSAILRCMSLKSITMIQSVLPCQRGPNLGIFLVDGKEFGSGNPERAFIVAASDSGELVPG